MITIDIVFKSSLWCEQEELKKLVQTNIKIALIYLGFQDLTSELSVIFTNDKEIKFLNDKWRNKEKATNVLSFPAFSLKAGDRPCAMMGDIILARETIEHEAAVEAKLFFHHLSHLLVHGLLHLLGYDHKKKEDAEIMEILERKILHVLNIPDPYALLS